MMKSVHFILCLLACLTVGAGLGEVGREDVHEWCLGDRGDFKVGHRVVHAFHKGGKGALEITGLNHLETGCAFLDGGFLINGDKVGFHLIPAVARLIIEYITELDALDGVHAEFTRDEGLHLVGDAGLSFGK